ncbi:MAG TPA: hypothetical protein VK828_01425 [Terriglobales bacterium]|jgi:hypothetical protein|nr:hypothetical protein [Terriglobales bacterium]
MRSKYLVCLLLGSLTYGQSAPSPMMPAAGAKPEQNAPAATGRAAADADKAPEAKAPEVGPNDTVITIKGFCPGSSEQGDACKTVITRAQFDTLADALQPNMSPAIRRQLATRYSWALKMSAEAEKRGLDKGPVFEEKMKWARMTTLAQELIAGLQEDSAKVTDADVEDYYKKNEATYEQATLTRIFIPKTKQITPATAPKTTAKTGTGAGAKAGATAPKAGTTATAKAPAQPTEAQKKAAEEAMKKLATSLRERAVQGEDPDKLQKIAYTAAGLPGVPSTKLEKQRRANLPPAHQAVMDLKPGEVSEVITDPNSGYYIYKMVSKETLSLEAATPEIRKVLSSQRYRDTMQSYQSAPDLNDAYFGPARTPGMPMPPRGPMPHPQHSPDHAPDND